MTSVFKRLSHLADMFRAAVQDLLFIVCTEGKAKLGGNHDPIAYRFQCFPRNHALFTHGLRQRNDATLIDLAQNHLADISCRISRQWRTTVDAETAHCGLQQKVPRLLAALFALCRAAAPARGELARFREHHQIAQQDQA